MALLLSSNGGSVTAWRTAEDFTAAYRQTLLEMAASDHDNSSEAVFSETCAALETAITTHQDLLMRLNGLIEEVVAATASTRLNELTGAYYGDLYRHFGRFRSASAFYQMSMTFLRQISAVIIAQTTDKLGISADDLPEMALIAIGPAGRCEYSPYCPLQILLVHGEATASQIRNITRFCQTLHAGFEDAGLAIDPVVTPCNANWRGTLSEWQQRGEEGLHSLTDNKLIDFCRLIDQYPLYPVEGLAGELKQISSTILSGNRPALANMIVRMTSLSNGIGFMGRLKLERTGSERGKFSLLNHGLLPLSAALSTLALIKKSAATSNCERIHELLKRRELDAGQAEIMLETWRELHTLRLSLEDASRTDASPNRPIVINPNELTAEQLQSLKKNLESVAVIQRHVLITFSGMGE